MTLATELAKHVGHRLHLPTVGKLRCHDCTQTIDLRSALAPPGSTSTSSHPAPEQQCPQHRGQPADGCAPCRAERLERTTEPTVTPPQRASAEAIAAARALYEQTRRKDRP